MAAVVSCSTRLGVSRNALLHHANSHIITSFRNGLVVKPLCCLTDGGSALTAINNMKAIYLESISHKMRFLALAGMRSTILQVMMLPVPALYMSFVKCFKHPFNCRNILDAGKDFR